MENISIRSVTPEDLIRLQAISRQTFTEAFAAGNTEENMSRYLEEGFSTKQLAAELDNEYSQFYFAEQDGSVIGYLKLNIGPAQTELKEDKGLEIERIYVLEACYGQKVGQLLYHKAIEVAREMQAEYVWLGVWEENRRAIRFYEKNGFVAFDKHLFRLGSDEQTDLLMKRPLHNQLQNHEKDQQP